MLHIRFVYVDFFMGAGGPKTNDSCVCLSLVGGLYLRGGAMTKEVMVARKVINGYKMDRCEELDANDLMCDSLTLERVVALWWASGEGGEATLACWSQRRTEAREFW
jgi:hypothetical protein